MLESKFQNTVLKPRIKELLPGCVILKNDPNGLQGIPDLVVFWMDRYAILEVKKNKNASYRPNQEWYLNKFGNDFGTFAATVYPENFEEVIGDLVDYFRR